MKTDGTLSRAIAIIMPGRVLSQPAKQTSASYAWPRTTASTLSAMISRDSSENFMPWCCIEMPSETEIVRNSRGVPPASTMPRRA